MKTLDMNIDKRVRWDTEGPSIQRVQSFLLCETSEVWYSRKDIAGFQQSCEVSRKMARKGINIPTLASSWGLEHAFCDELHRERKNRRQEAWDAVLEEQDYQLEYDDFSTERLAESYQDIARESQLQAHRQALRYRHELLKEDGDYQPPCQPLYDANTMMHLPSLYKTKEYPPGRNFELLLPAWQLAGENTLTIQLQISKF